MHSICLFFFFLINALHCLCLWTSLLAAATVFLVLFYVPSVLVFCPAAAVISLKSLCCLSSCFTSRTRSKLYWGSEVKQLHLSVSQKNSITEMCLSSAQQPREQGSNPGAWCAAPWSEGLKFTLPRSVLSPQEQKEGVELLLNPSSQTGSYFGEGMPRAGEETGTSMSLCPTREGCQGRRAPACNSAVEVLAREQG